MKAVNEIIAVLIIVGISLSLFSAVYLWGRPLIEKRQYSSQINQVKSFFDQQSELSLPSKIENVANLGGEETFRLETKGVWRLNETENYIEFSFFSKTTPYAPDLGWIALTPGASCPPASGIVGKDRATVVCVQSKNVTDGYEISYRVYLRDLVDQATDKTYRIKLVRNPGGPSKSSGNLIILNRGNTFQTQQLIETEVIVLLS